MIKRCICMILPIMFLAPATPTVSLDRSSIGWCCIRSGVVTGQPSTQHGAVHSSDAVLRATSSPLPVMLMMRTREAEATVISDAGRYHPLPVRGTEPAQTSRTQRERARTSSHSRGCSPREEVSPERASISVHRPLQRISGTVARRAVGAGGGPSVVGDRQGAACDVISGTDTRW